MKDKTDKPSNSHAKWTDDDDEYLMQMWDTGVPRTVMMKVLGRSESSINSRIVKHLDILRFMN